MLKILKKKVVIIILIVAAIAAGVYFTLRGGEKVEYVTALAEKGNIVQTVSETGTLKAASEINLNFLNTGKIAKISVKVGEKIEAGQVLAELDYSALAIKKEEAQASLNKLLAGATREEIAVSQAGVNQAEAAYFSAQQELVKITNTVNEDRDQAEKDLNDFLSSSPTDVTTYEQAIAKSKTSLENTKSTYQQAINNKRAAALTTIGDKLAAADIALDKINSILNDEDAEDFLSVKNSFYLTQTKESYSEAYILLPVADSSLTLAKATQSEANINKSFNDSLAALNKTFDSLNNCFKALENSITGSVFTQSELDAFKTSVSTQLTTIATSITSVQTAQQNLDDAILSYNTNVASAQKNLDEAETNYENAVLTAKNNLNSAIVNGEQQITTAQSKAGSAKEALDVARAQLAQLEAAARPEDIALARASLDTVSKQIEDSILAAPIAGTITKINYEVGEQATSQQPALSMLGVNNFEIEVLISETDIAKIKMGNGAEITFDAFGDEVKFSGHVFFIEPAETIIQDVVYYKVKIEFEARPDYEPKSGMTANATIITSSKEGVIIIPTRAVIESGGQKKVRKLVGGQLVEGEVELGLRGDEGMVEVISGVSEGETVVTFVRQN